MFKTGTSLALLRIGLPGAIAMAGLVLIVIGGAVYVALGAALLVVSLIAILTDALARLTISSQDDRDREQAARERFSQTGRWSRRRRASRTD